MSIASTQLAMRYVAFTHATDRCGICDFQVGGEKERDLRCGLGHFYVSRTGTCSRFRIQPARADAGGRIQVGPTDI